MNCPVCGHVDGACTGSTKTNSHEIITSSGIVKRIGPERVPRQRNSIGRAGYIGEGSGKVEVYDPAAPHIRFVDEPSTEQESPPAFDSGDEAAWTERPGAVLEERWTERVTVPAGVLPAFDEKIRDALAREVPKRTRPARRKKSGP